MASGKRISGTILFVIAFLATVGIAFLLFAKAARVDSVPFADQVPTAVLWAAGILTFIIVILLLVILIRGRDERRNRKAEEAAALFADEEQARQAAFESSLVEPTGIGLGPEIVVYSLPGIIPMYRAWEKMDKKTKVIPFTFPRTVEAALYSNDYIDIGQGKKIKLRTLLAGPKDAQKKELGIANMGPRRATLASIDPKSIPEHLRARFFPTETPANGAALPAETAAIVSTGPKDVASEVDQALGRSRTTLVAQRAYYDYVGDVHDVEEIEGIGRIYGNKLKALGVHTTARLCYEDPDELAANVGVPRKSVEQWQHMAELIKIKGVGKQYAEAMARAGVQGIADLKKRSAATITEQVNEYLDSLQTSVLGNKITPKRVEGWQKAAADMRRVRLKVPEN